jgi:uncharacterized protein (TIGR03437 family)
MKIKNQVKRPSGLKCAAAQWLSAAIALATVLAPAAQAQTSPYSVDPSAITFTFSPGGSSPDAKQVAIFSSSSSVASVTFVATAVVTTPAGGNWLTIGASAASANVTTLQAVTPGYIYAKANTTGLTAGTYTGQIKLGPDANTTLMTIPVTLTSTGTQAGQLSVSASQLAFSYSTTGSAPASQTLTLTNNATTTLDYSVTSAVTTGPASWLNVTASSSNLSAGTSVQIPVGINIFGLTTGTYQATITIRSNTATNTPITVGVTLYVNTTAALLSATPAQLTFNYQTSSSAPAQQLITLSNPSSQTLDYSVSSSIASGPSGWLNVTAATGNLNSAGNVTIPVSIVTTGLTTGSYQGSVTIRSNTASNSPLTIPVTLNVNTLAVFPTQLTFLYQTGTTVPATQTLLVTNPAPISPPPALNYSVAVSDLNGGTNWLVVTPANGNTPGAVLVSVDPTNLSAGTYTGNVAITSQSTGTVQKVPVSLTVSSSALLSASPSWVTFAWQSGTTAPSAQSIQVGSTGGAAAAQNFTVSVSNGTSSVNWLSANPSSGTTPATVTFNVTPTTLGVGTYYGSVTITGQGSGNVITIPVSITVNPFALITGSPTVLTFNAPLNGAAPAAQSITIGSTSSAIPFTATASSLPSAWLTLDKTTGSTSDNTRTVNVSVATTGLPQGTYYGQVTVSAFGVANSPLVIPVVLTVANTATIVVDQPQLNFTQFQGSTTGPAAKTLAVTSSGSALTVAVAATTATGGSWLTATPSSGTTPMSVSVSVVNAGSLRPDTYQGFVTLTSAGATNSPQIIPVVLTVSQPVTLTYSPTSLSTSATVGAANPADQNITLTSSGPAVPFTTSASTSNGGNWLSVKPASGNATATVTVSYTTSGLAAGTYNGTVTISPSGLTAISVPVTLTVNEIRPLITQIANAASFISAPVAPGEFIYIKGTNVGPATLTGLTVTGGVVDTKVGGTRVLFDGIPGPIVYASATQTTAIVPYEVGGRFATNITVELNGRASDPVLQRVDSGSLGIFTVNASGTGQGSILNQDGSLNGPSAPALAGQIISIYGTGEGATSPVVATGAVISTTAKTPAPVMQPVTVTINGIGCPVTYAGSVPTLVAGVLQVNCRIPAGLPIGALPIQIQMGNTGAFTSQPGVTVYIR